MKSLPINIHFTWPLGVSIYESRRFYQEVHACMQLVPGADMIAANDASLVALFLSWKRKMEREKHTVQLAADNDSDVGY